MKIVTWNLHGGRDAEGRPTLEGMIGFLRSLSPDLIGLQECVRHPGEEFMVLSIADALDMDAVWAPTIRDYQSNAILSRSPIGGYAVLRFNRSPREDERRLVIRADLSDELGPFSFFVTHLSLDEESRINQVKRVSEWIGNEERSILVGDFNDVPGSPAMAQVTLRDAATQEGPTFPSTGERLDYVFLGRAWREISYDVPSVKFSDHFPVVVEIESAEVR